MNNENLNESRNDEAKGLTVKKLREFEGFENLSNTEAEELIETYRKFSIITFNFFNKQLIKIGQL